MDVSEAWDKLEELGVSDETLHIVSDINGYSLETMEEILYATEGYQCFEQLECYEDEDEDE